MNTSSNDNHSNMMQYSDNNNTAYESQRMTDTGEGCTITNPPSINSMTTNPLVASDGATNSSAIGPLASAQSSSNQDMENKLYYVANMAFASDLYDFQGALRTLSCQLQNSRNAKANMDLNRIFINISYQATHIYLLLMSFIKNNNRTRVIQSICLDMQQYYTSEIEKQSQQGPQQVSQQITDFYKCKTVLMTLLQLVNPVIENIIPSGNRQGESVGVYGFISWQEGEMNSYIQELCRPSNELAYYDQFKVLVRFYDSIDKMCNILQPIAYIASEQNLSDEELRRFYANLSLIIDMLTQAMPSLQAAFASMTKDTGTESTSINSSNDASPLRALVKTLVQVEPDTIRQLKDMAQTFLPLFTSSIDMTGMQTAMQSSMSGIQSLLATASNTSVNPMQMQQHQPQQQLMPLVGQQQSQVQQQSPQFDIASLLAMLAQQQHQHQ